MKVVNYASCEERRPFAGKGEADIFRFGGNTVMRAVFEPGWRWSQNVKPLAGTDSCQTAHLGFCVSGRMHVVLDSGAETDVGPGDFFEIEPGHDAWVTSDEPCVMLDFGGVESYAARQARPSVTAAARPSVTH